jgi:hypothetical protein
MKFLRRNPPQGLTWFLLMFALSPHTLSSALEGGPERSVPPQIRQNCWRFVRRERYGQMVSAGEAG